MRLKESSCFVICFLMIFWIQVKSQEDENQFTNLDTITTLSSIFSDDTPAEIILKFDIRALQRNKFDSEYLPAELTFYPGDNLKESHFKVRVRARGISRKKLCSFPPILMNIKRSGIESNLIPESPNIKIVTRCKASSQYENCLLKEFLAYRIYNILSNR